MSTGGGSRAIHDPSIIRSDGSNPSSEQVAMSANEDMERFYRETLDQLRDQFEQYRNKAKRILTKQKKTIDQWKTASEQAAKKATECLQQADTQQQKLKQMTDENQELKQQVTNLKQQVEHMRTDKDRADKAEEEISDLKTSINALKENAKENEETITKLTNQVKSLTEYNGRLTSMLDSYKEKKDDAQTNEYAQPERKKEVDEQGKEQGKRRGMKRQRIAQRSGFESMATTDGVLQAFGASDASKVNMDGDNADTEQDDGGDFANFNIDEAELETPPQITSENSYGSGSMDQSGGGDIDETLWKKEESLEDLSF